MVKIGMIGAGGFVNINHYPSLAQFENVKLEAICDLDIEKMNRTVDIYGIENCFTNYKKMIESCDIDAVYIVMPPMFLKDIVMFCLNAGKHVFIEKPPGMTYQDTFEMAELSAKMGVKTMTGFNRRFVPMTNEVRRIIEQYSPLTSSLIEFHKNQYRCPPPYNISVLRIDAIHHVDTIRWLHGDVRTVKANKIRNECHAANIISVSCEHENGAMSNLFFNFSSGSRLERMELHGNGIGAYQIVPEQCDIFGLNAAKAAKEGAEFEAPDVTKVSAKEFYFPTPDLHLTAEELTHSNDMRVNLGYEAEDRYFIDCIENDVMPITCFADAYKTMRLVDDILEGGN